MLRYHAQSNDEMTRQDGCERQDDIWTLLSALSHEHVASGVTQQTCCPLAQTEILLTTEEGKRQTPRQHARERETAPESAEHRDKTVPQPHAWNDLISSTDHSLWQIAVHMIPFSTSVFAAPPTIHSASVTLNFPTLDQCCVFIIRRLKTLHTNQSTRGYVHSAHGSTRNTRKHAYGNTTTTVSPQSPVTQVQHKGPVRLS